MAYKKVGMKFKGAIDWEAVRHEWLEKMRADGKVNYSALAEQFGISGQSVRNKAKQYGWSLEPETFVSGPGDVGPDLPDWGEAVSKTPLADSKETNTAVNQIKAATEILNYIACGATEELAANAAGINVKTWRNWKSRGGKEFRELVRRARGRLALQRINVIDKAGLRGDWRAAAWLVERDQFTREQFVRKDEAGAGITVNINVPRAEGVTIEAEPKQLIEGECEVVERDD